MYFFIYLFKLQNCKDELYPFMLGKKGWPKKKYVVWFIFIYLKYEFCFQNLGKGANFLYTSSLFLSRLSIYYISLGDIGIKIWIHSENKFLLYILTPTYFYHILRLIWNKIHRAVYWSCKLSLEYFFLVPDLWNIPEYPPLNQNFTKFSQQYNLYLSLIQFLNIFSLFSFFRYLLKMRKSCHLDGLQTQKINFLLLE